MKKFIIILISIFLCSCKHVYTSSSSSAASPLIFSNQHNMLYLKKWDLKDISEIKISKETTVIIKCKKIYFDKPLKIVLEDKSKLVVEYKKLLAKRKSTGYGFVIDDKEANQVKIRQVKWERKLETD